MAHQNSASLWQQDLNISMQLEHNQVYEDGRDPEREIEKKNS